MDAPEPRPGAIGCPRVPGDAAPLKLAYFPPSAALFGLVTTFYHLRHEASRIRDIQPAAVGHLLIFFEGSGQMVFAGEQASTSHRVTLLCPCTAAARIEMDGPIDGVGAALSPFGWAAFTGLDAGQHGDRQIDARKVFGPGIDAVADDLAAARAAGERPEDLCERLGRYLLGKLRPVNPRHVKLMRATAEWLGSSLDPSAEALYRAVSYSPRQTQRLVERYFGLPPRELRRKYRAIRAATLMALDHPSESDLAATAELFSDQSHMIREIRHFVGRTPGKLSEESNSILSALLDIRNFRLVKPQVAAMPAGLGENDSQ